MFKDMITFLGLDYRDALLTILYLVVKRISIPKIDKIILSCRNKRKELTVTEGRTVGQTDPSYV